MPVGPSFPGSGVDQREMTILTRLTGPSSRFRFLSAISMSLIPFIRFGALKESTKVGFGYRLRRRSQPWEFEGLIHSNPMHPVGRLVSFPFHADVPLAWRCEMDSSADASFEARTESH